MILKYEKINKDNIVTASKIQSFLIQVLIQNI